MNALNIGLTKDHNLTTDIYQEHSKLIQIEGEKYIIYPEYFNGQILINNNTILTPAILQNGDLIEFASLKFIWNPKIALALALIHFSVKRIISIGRSQTNHITINDPIVLEYHACIIHTLQNEFYILDFNEGIGTYINGVPVKIARLNPAHTLVLGTTPYNWKDLAASEDPSIAHQKRKYIHVIFIFLDFL